MLVWILVLSLIALALSAWIKWKIAAGGLVLGVFFAGAGFGTALNSVMRTNYGSLLNLTAGDVHHLVAVVSRGPRIPASPRRSALDLHRR